MARLLVLGGEMAWAVSTGGALAGEAAGLDAGLGAALAELAAAAALRSGPAKFSFWGGLERTAALGNGVASA
ncbi:MAG: hypothetical protein EAZ54_09965 [Curvibacter sp.]|nr:MAG: hypothetical protein EAZ54_09965 [Curvibacter sp.]